jgi:hypothetical protein
MRENKNTIYSLDEYRKMHTSAEPAPEPTDYTQRARSQIMNAIAANLIERIAAVPLEYMQEMVTEIREMVHNGKITEDERGNILSISLVVTDLYDCIATIQSLINPESIEFTGYGMGRDRTLEEYSAHCADEKEKNRAIIDDAAATLAEQMRRRDEAITAVNTAIADSGGAQWQTREVGGTVQVGYYRGDEWIKVADIGDMLLIGGVGIDIR